MTAPSVVLNAPSGISPGSTVMLPDGSTTTVDANGQITASAPFIAQLLGQGWTYTAASATGTSSAQSSATSAGIADSQSRSDAVSAGLADSQTRSDAVSLGIADSATQSSAKSAGTSASIARSSITSGSV